MIKKYMKFLLITFFLMADIISCAQYKDTADWRIVFPNDIKVGAERTKLYFPILKNKTIAVVANQSSLIGKAHLVDSLISAGFTLKKIFCPEHGFRGEADAGELIVSNKDQKTGLQVVSLYGKNKKPLPEDLKDIDIVIFDIQDVGVRFYTYISTMHYVMEACAENKIQLIILDRPNPNGHYIDGPVMKKEFTSFIGMHCVPLVHGMTIAEFARMINDEGWLKNGIKCKLTYIPVEGYKHSYFYQLPVKPSPNLPNMKAVYLYPSIGLFESTVISVGRGTDKPFQVFGHPELKNYKYTFIPQSKPGAKSPLYEGKICYGLDLSIIPDTIIRFYKKLSLIFIKEAYQNFPKKEFFFSSFFDKLAGTEVLKQQIIQNKSEKEIRDSWQKELELFKKTRKKYLLYTDFE